MLVPWRINTTEFVFKTIIFCEFSIRLLRQGFERREADRFLGGKEGCRKACEEALQDGWLGGKKGWWLMARLMDMI